MNLLIMCILFILVLHCTLNEGYINKPPPNKPDATQFLACMDDNTAHLGNNNYKIRMHRLGDKLEGPYTYFLDENNKWDQWCGKLCTYKKQKDAIAFGYKIAAAVSKATDLDSIKKVVEINSAYKKVFS